MTTSSKERLSLPEIEKTLILRLARTTGSTESSPTLEQLLLRASSLPSDASIEMGASLADDTWAEFWDAIHHGPEAQRKHEWHRQTHDTLESAGIRLVQARLMFDAVLVCHGRVLSREKVHEAHAAASDRYNRATERYNDCLNALMTDFADNEVIDDTSIFIEYEEALREVNDAGNELLQARNSLEAIREMNDAQIAFPDALERYHEAARDYRVARSAHDDSSVQMAGLENLERALLLLKRPIDPDDTGYY